MSEAVPTPIIDKNGKPTTVRKNPAKLFPERLTAAQLAPKPSVMQTVAIRNTEEAKAAVYAIPADAPILAGYLAKHRDIMSPIDEDDFEHEGWEDLALHYARLNLWNAYEHKFNKELNLAETTEQSAVQTAEFIVNYQNSDFPDVKAADNAIKEYFAVG